MSKIVNFMEVEQKESQLSPSEFCDIIQDCFMETAGFKRKKDEDRVKDKYVK